MPVLYKKMLAGPGSSGTKTVGRIWEKREMEGALGGGEGLGWA